MGTTPKHESFNDGAKREQELRLAEKIVNSDISDLEKATELSRLFKDSKYFKSRYFFLLKENNKYFTGKIDIIMQIYELILKYEKEGLYEKVKYDDKFKIDNYKIDSRVIIKDYIEDFNSYNIRKFYEKHGIRYDTFKTCESNIRCNDKKLYDKYLEIKRLNDTKEILIPIMRLSEIRESIKCGTTSEGKPFDAFEFWKLNPFVVENLDFEINYLKRKHPEIRKISQINRESNKQVGQKKLYYKDLFCNFVEMCGFDPDETIKNYMEENGIKSCTLFSRDKVNNNFGLYKQDNITPEDLNNIMDYMEMEGIPFVEDALLRLEKEYAFQKSCSKNLRKELSKQLIREE